MPFVAGVERNPLPNLFVLATFAVFSGLGMAVVMGLISETLMLAALVGTAATGLLLAYPEVALGMLLSIGAVKGNPRMASLGFDVTLALGIIIASAVLIRCRHGARQWLLSLPKVYWLYIPFLALMLLSLTYTPNLAGGVDKAGRFLVFGGIAILAPFFVLDSRRKTERFFLTLVAMGVVLALDSFSMLGGKERLIPAGGNTIQLGHYTALAIVIIWYLLLPGRSIPVRALLYGAILLLTVALLGSGSRGPAISVVVCLLLGFVFYRRLATNLSIKLLDLAVLMGLAVALLPVTNIPQQSYDYLGRLIDPDVHRFLGPRESLMRLAWQMTREHPFLGVGIGGYPLVYRGIGAWPHNVFLEVSCEMGLIASFLVICICTAAFRESIRQLSRPASSYRHLCNTTFAFLVLETIAMMNTGSINDNRAVWLAMSLPFLLRKLQSGSQENASKKLESMVALGPRPVQSGWDQTSK